MLFAVSSLISLDLKADVEADLEILLFSTDRADTSPAENTNDPTPRSINDVPQVSTFANRRGKTWKSTARMAMQVTISMQPRYVVTNPR